MYGFPQNYYVANFRTVNEQDGEDIETRRKFNMIWWGKHCPFHFTGDKAEILWLLGLPKTLQLLSGSVMIQLLT